MKADTSPSPVKIANTMPYVYSIVKTQKAGVSTQFRNVRFMLSPPSLVFVAPAAGVGVTDDPASA